MLAANITKLVPILRCGKIPIDGPVKEKFTEKLESDRREFGGPTGKGRVQGNGIQPGSLEAHSKPDLGTANGQGNGRYSTRESMVNDGPMKTGLGKVRIFPMHSLGTRLTDLRNFSRPRPSLRSVMAKAPQAEAIAVSWFTRVRPGFARAYAFRRRIATVAVTILAVSLFVHVMFGANGMVVYRQKRAEFQALQKQIADVQRENDSFTHQIQGLKSDVKTIEKEAREQLGYARPGEYVYVAPAPAKPAPPPASHSAKK